MTPPTEVKAAVERPQDAIAEAIVFLRARTKDHTDTSEPNIPVHYIRTVLQALSQATEENGRLREVDAAKSAVLSGVQAERDEANAEVERLKADVTALMEAANGEANLVQEALEALKPFAAIADAFEDESWAEDDAIAVSCCDWVVDDTKLSVYDIRRAAALLSRSAQGGGHG